MITSVFLLFVFLFVVGGLFVIGCCILVVLGGAGCRGGGGGAGAGAGGGGGGAVVRVDVVAGH